MILEMFLEGHIFVAITGFKEDGHQFIEDAIDRGAIGIIAEKDVHISNGDIGVIKVDDSRKTLSKMSARFYDYPSREMTIIGVTGN